MDADLYDEFASLPISARSQRARVSLADLGLALSPARSQGNYIGPDDDLESDISGDEDQQQANGAGAGDAEPPLRAYDEDDAAELPLDGMEVDGECSQDLPRASRSLKRARRASLELLTATRGFLWEQSTDLS